MTRRPTAMAVAMVLLLLSAALDAQWLKYPTPGIPRLRVGRPDLSAPAPRMADGKPDISGLWPPGAYAKPWTVTLPSLFQADTSCSSTTCNENNRYFEIVPKK